MFRKIIGNLKLFFAGIFWGLKAGDVTVTKGNSTSSEISQQKAGGGGVFENFLKGEETQEVKETRDAYYRVLKEADQYEVRITGGFKKDQTPIDSEYTTELGEVELATEEYDGSDITAEVHKKTNRFIEANVCVLETPGYKVEVIQDRKTYENDADTQMKEATLGYEINDPKVEIFSIERDFIARFPIEFMVQKAVVKKSEKGNKRILDLYFSIYPRQFVKKDALFISELKKIFDDKNYRTDTFDFKSFEFITDKCFGVENLHKFKFGIDGFRSMQIFDGNYVASFNVSTLVDEDVTAKYQTEELSQKYADKAPKHDNIDINTIIRNI